MIWDWSADDARVPSEVNGTVFDRQLLTVADYEHAARQITSPAM